MNSLLIADSGSSKTDWVLISETDGTFEVHTTGINPVRDSESAISCILTNELLPQLPHTHISAVHFYGAGCIAPYSTAVSQQLALCLPESEIHVESDLLGAARALCGTTPGIACILGTGSNSCLYNGKEIVANGNANTVLALTKAECACNFNFFFEIVIRDQGADGFNNLTGAFQVARASDTYSNSEFHKNNPFVNDRM
jgi:hypothetical protein